MMRRIIVLAAATVAISGFTSTIHADQAGESAHRVSELEARLAELNAKIERMEAGQSEIDEQRAEEIRSLVRDVLADADERASLLQNGVCAGRDKFFFIASADGAFKLNILGMVQPRFMASIQDDDAAGDRTRHGFEMSRTRVGVLGHVVDPSWKFCVWAGWLSNGSSFLVENWIRKEFDNGWKVDFGHFKLPLWTEWYIPEFHQQFIERSMLNNRFAGAGKGVRAVYTNGDFRFWGCISDGSRTWNKPWSTGPGTTSGAMPYQLSSEYALTARVEYMLQGDWAGAKHLESWVGDDQSIRIGAAAHYQVGEYGTADDEAEVFQWATDVSFAFGGGNLHAGVIGTHYENSSVERDEWGFLLSGGVFLTEEWELIGRFEYGDLDGAGTISDEMMVATIGVTRFWNKHGLKWMADIGYAFEAVDPGWAANGAGWRADGADQDGQVVIRTQLQLMF